MTPGSSASASRSQPTNPLRRARGIAALLLVFCVIWTPLSATPPKQLFLELDMAIERGGTVAILFDFGDGIWGDGAALAEVPPGTTPRPVRLQMPTRPIRALRLDPTTDDQPVLIQRIRLVSAAGDPLLSIDPHGLQPMHQIQSIVPEGQGVRVHPTPQAHDAMLRLEISPLQQKIHEAIGRPTVDRSTVAMLAIVCFGLIALAVVTAWRAHGNRAGFMGTAALFCTVFGARLLWLNVHGKPVPFWDEWEGDVLYVLIPFVGGFLDWGALIMPQWEHRIFLTRVITLFGTLLNGEWDPRVAMTVSAAMFSATIALIGTVLLSTRRLTAVIAAVALAMSAALPYDFNNVFWGGQTQMYGLVLLAVCAIALASARQITTAIYVGAAGGSLLSLFTMGAGPVGPACAAGICLVRCWLEKERRHALLRLAAIFFFAALLGVFLHVSSRAHVPLYANSVAQFQRAFTGVLAWPLPPRAWWAALLWVPWLVNGILILRRREGTSLEWLAVGLGGWSMINAIALGYARQYEGPPFDSRFFTAFSLGAIGSLCSSVALVLRAPSRIWSWRQTPHLAWAAMLVGLMGAGIKGLADTRVSGAERAELDHRIRVFLSTGDRTPLLEKPPHHTGTEVIARLESPLFQQILPAPYRRALAARSSPAAAPPAEAGYLTLTIRTLMKIGPVIAALGLIGCGYILWQTKRNQPRISGVTRLRPLALSNRTCYIIAGCIIVGWTLIYHHMRSGGLVDEPGHLAAVHHFLEEKPAWPESMPMLPGYHFIVVSLWKLWPSISTLAMSRLVTALVTLIGFAAFALAWQKIHAQPAGRATLLLALLPLTQPFTGMAYSDMPALGFALVALWAQVTGRWALAALVLAGSIGIRQTNLIWAGFFIAWEYFRPDAPHGTVLHRIKWMLLLLATAAAVILAAGRLTVGVQHGNTFEFNPAGVHFAALLLLLLGLPVWVAHLPACLAGWRAAAQARPTRAAVIGALAAAAVAALTLSYRNPHIWNREVFWEGCSFTLLRNWPLIWADTHLSVRIASALNVVVMAVALVRVFAGQPHWRALYLALAIGAIPVLTNGLVEPRYMIPAAGFLLCFLEFNAVEWRRLAVWWAVLTAVHAPFVATALSLW